MPIFTAYFDESGTHAGAEISVMAGFVGDARQWRKFEKRIRKLFGHYRVDVFHAIDVRRSDDDFEGWTVDRKIKFLDEFQHIINDTLLGGVTAVIRQDDYDYYCGLDWPRKTRWDSKYGLLFRGCFAHMIDLVGHLPNAYEPRLCVVLEDGHKNAADVARIYNWAQNRLGQRHALFGLTFDNKQTCLPLAAADLLAYSAWGQLVGQKPIGVLTGPSKSAVSYQNNLVRIDLIRGSLDSLHEQAIKLAQERGSFGDAQRLMASGVAFCRLHASAPRSLPQLICPTGAVCKNPSSPFRKNISLYPNPKSGVGVLRSGPP